MPASRARTAICSAPLEWPSRPGLPDEDLDPAAEGLGHALDPVAQLGERRRRPARPRRRRRRWARGTRRTPRAASPAHSPVVAPACAAASVAGITFTSGEEAAARSSLESRVHGGLVALGAPRAHGVDLPLLDRGVHGHDPAVLALLERRGLVLGVDVLADHLLLAALDPLDARAVRLHELGLHVAARPRPRRPARRRSSISARAPSASSSTRPSITCEPSKMSG